ncbi:hypothetical protein [uncultured Aquimarina sp.]|uniref:hypothetical protein n=1 Tax=uncultured Aquimarina sp. TaxID=575652 RepID=UPI0026179D0F|nr:hypothetical protein [uncultured Aquimarina sp.]
MKTKIITLLLLVNCLVSFACDLCKKNQPKGLEDITHGEGPEGNIDYIIMYSAIIIVGYTLIMSLKYLIKPKEKEDSHIKNLVLNENNTSS